LGATVAFALPIVRFAVEAWSVPAPPASANFSRPLAVPPLARSTVDSGGRRTFDLRLQEGTVDFGHEERARTWGVNGPYLGPTVRARRGEQVMMNVSNGLGETTTLHWHGMHLPAAMDGGPHQMIEPGGTWSPTWTIDQPAATLWYHPHLHGRTADHVYRGLAGMFIVDDESVAGLPSQYGVDDVPVVVQDKAFTGEGQLDDDAPALSPVGLLGDTLVVNGTIGTYHDVTTERVRLRLLNASNARIYNLGFDDDRQFDLVGTDGGLLPAPVATRRAQLSPGERAEIVVAVEAGEDVVLRSFASDLGADWWSQRFAGGNDTFDVLQLRAADRLKPSPAVPSVLVPNPDLGHDRGPATTTRHFELNGTEINGREMDMSRIDVTVEAGSTELWNVNNEDGTPHNFHVHGVSFRVVNVDGRPPPPALTGLKDTVYVAPETTVRLLVTFLEHIDPDTPYMFHCHVLRHEDRGMMGQFVVVGAGERAGTPSRRAPHERLGR